jgi:GDPmannose 4,6-dehydratase
MKKALITGILGQDGSYLAELLLKKGYEVYGVLRSKDSLGGEEDPWRVRRIADKLTLFHANIADYDEVRQAIVRVRPDEVYHLASLHEVKNTPENFRSILEINFCSTYNFLQAIRDELTNAKFFFAGSSRVFAGNEETPQNESTQMKPLSLYGITKAASIDMVRMFREREGLFSCSGILYNHESPRRDPEFLTRKISRGIAEIKSGLVRELRLGDLDAKRDWGFAGDFVEAMWLMLQQNTPDDYILGTGETHSVKDFLDAAFCAAGLDWKDFVRVDGGLMRPKEPELRADIAKAKRRLGWSPKMKFEDLARMMVEADSSMADLG